MDYATSRKKKDILVIILISVTIVLVILGIIYMLNKMNNSESGNEATPTPTATPEPTEEPTPSPTPYIYINEVGMTVATRFYPPDGYKRQPVEEGSFAEYLRNLPLKMYGEHALLYNKSVNESAPIYGVLDQTIAKKDIQQCADTVMRIWAEYLYANERYSEISFDFFTTPVFKCDFENWAKGNRVKVDTKTNKCSWYESDRATKDDYSYENFTAYMEYVYVYANTNSYKLQTAKVTADEVGIGTMIIGTAQELNKANPGLDATLGHALLVVDCAVNAEGEKVFLLMEGNTPATQPYIVGSITKEFGGMWVKLEDGIYHSHSDVYYTADCYRSLG